MISKELRQAWGKVANNLSYKTNGRDFTPNLTDTKNFLRSFFSRKALEHITDETLGQNYDVIVQSLSKSMDDPKYPYAVEAAVISECLDAHIAGKVSMNGMKLLLSDKAAPN